MAKVGVSIRQLVESLLAQYPTDIFRDRLDRYTDFDIIRMEFEIVFYIDENSKNPVEEFLTEILKKNRPLWAQTISGLQKIKQRAYHREPLSKALGGNLWEVRIRSRNDILRIFYTFAKGKKIILLHGFIKNTQKIPRRELDIAKRRLKKLKEDYL